jgi:hypothetical protein
MSDNETFQWQGLIVIAGVLGVAAGVLLSPFPALTLAVLVVGVTATLLLWHALAVRAYRRPDNAILARPPWILLSMAVLLLGTAAVLYAFPVTRDNFIFFVLPIFLFGIFYGGYLPTTLLFWVTTPDALTRQVLSFKKTLLWRDIDWVYGKRKRMTQQAFNAIPVARWTEETLFVEAGPKRRIVVVLRAPLVRSDATPLLEAIRTRAGGALFGFDQFPAVVAHRSARPYAPPDPMRGGSFDLETAARLGRTGFVPDGWTLLPLRRANTWSNVIGLSLVGVAMFVGAMYLYLTSTLIPEKYIPIGWRTPDILTLLLIAQTVVLTVIAVGFYIWGIRWFQPLRHLQDYFFLVTPLGFLEAKGKQVTGAAFADVRELRLGSGLMGWQLVAQLRSGAKLEFDIGNNYGPGRELYAYALAGLSAARDAAGGAQRQSELGPFLDFEGEAGG